MSVTQAENHKEGEKPKAKIDGTHQENENLMELKHPKTNKWKKVQGKF